MASSVQLRNYLETLQVDPASCQGFEDEALGACIGLVGWGTARMPARMAWTRAIYAASFNTTGTLQGDTGGDGHALCRVKIENFIAHAHNEATKRAFRIDAARRDYDRIISGNVTASQ